MVKEIDLYRQEALLLSEAKAFEISKKRNERLAAEWEAEIGKRVSGMGVNTGQEEARLNRDWHLQLADTDRLAAKQARKKAGKLHKKAARKEARYARRHSE